LAQPHPQHYQQFLLYADPQDRFSVVSFVWGPGQATPVHDHTVWGLVGMLRGSESCQPYSRMSDGRWVPAGFQVDMLPGDIEAVSPRIGDVHKVWNALRDQVSISIHVYGGNIGKIERHSYREDGSRATFVSGYSNVMLLGEQKEIVSKVAGTAEEAAELEAAGWWDHPAKSLAARPGIDPKKVPQISSDSRIKDLEAKIAALEAEKARATVVRGAEPSPLAKLGKQ
jgi:predicted metal-dependent enzyme (double-stranded beta helix superfamily)